jgi:hypothetical protein
MWARSKTISTNEGRENEGEDSWGGAILKRDPRIRHAAERRVTIHTTSRVLDPADTQKTGATASGDRPAPQPWPALAGLGLLKSRQNKKDVVWAG